MSDAIKEFFPTIKRGPFKCLRNYEGQVASEYIATQKNSKGDIYDCAVYEAWLDMCRTVPGAGKEKKRQCEKARETAASELRRYFSGKPKATAEAFEGWIGSALSNVSAPTDLTIGQAQKILNMAFKYLYCCEDIRSKYEKHFTYCHMPLDSFTLNWYKKNCAAVKYDGTVWSKITDVSMYFNIQKEIREKLGGKDVLLQEFSIWQKEKEAAE